MIFRRRSVVEMKIPRSIRSRWIFANQISTWLSHERLSRERVAPHGVLFERLEHHGVQIAAQQRRSPCRRSTPPPARTTAGRPLPRSWRGLRGDAAGRERLGGSASPSGAPAPPSRQPLLQRDEPGIGRAQPHVRADFRSHRPPLGADIDQTSLRFRRPSPRVRIQLDQHLAPLPVCPIVSRARITRTPTAVATGCTALATSSRAASVTWKSGTVAKRASRPTRAAADRTPGAGWRTAPGGVRRPRGPGERARHEGMCRRERERWTQIGAMVGRTPRARSGTECGNRSRSREPANGGTRDCWPCVGCA
jgi:hypothetical protein